MFNSVTTPPLKKHLIHFNLFTHCVLPNAARVSYVREFDAGEGTSLVFFNPVLKQGETKATR